MQIATAHQEMVAAHVRGAPGVFVSGVVWLIAGGLWSSQGVVVGFQGLFVGGVLIFPVSLLISRLLFRAPKASPGNPLERLALESTVMLFAGILFAYCFLRVAPDLAFPAVAVAIGARYFVFRSVYGSPIFWGLGGALTIVGGLGLVGLVSLPVNLALVVGAIEVGFSLIIYLFGGPQISRQI